MYSYNKGKIKLIKETSGILNNFELLLYQKKDCYILHKLLIKNCFKIGKNETNLELIKIVKSDYAYDNLFYDKME